MILRKKKVCMYCKTQKPNEIKLKEFIGWICKECKHIICSQCVKDLESVGKDLTCVYIDWLHKKEIVEFAPSIFNRIRSRFENILVNLIFPFYYCYQKIKDWLNKPDPYIPPLIPPGRDNYYSDLAASSVTEGTPESYDGWHINKIPDLWGFNIYATETGIPGKATLSGNNLFVSYDDYDKLRSLAPLNSKVFKQWIRELGVKS